MFVQPVEVRLRSGRCPVEVRLRSGRCPVEVRLRSGRCPVEAQRSLFLTATQPVDP